MSPLIDRREFMQLMGAALALAEGGCARAPLEPIVPYSDQPEGLVQGLPLFFATCLTRSGYACGVLVESQMGRPTKIEGNPHHPASLGSTGPIEQGRILQLWDPERSRACLHHRQIVAWERVARELGARAASWEPTQGKGVRLLIPTSSSPTLRRQIDALMRRFSEMRLHVHEAVDRDSTYRATHSLFGRVLEPVYRLERARTIVSLDADFLGALPGNVRYARDFAQARRPDMGTMSRLYAAECSPTLTGVAADHYLAVRPAELQRLAASLAQCLRTGTQSEVPWLRNVLADLEGSRGDSLVLAGDAQPAELHALAYALNVELGNVGRTIEFIEPVCDLAPVAGTLAGLAEDMHAGRVNTLIVLDCNPVYSGPGSLEFAAALRRVAESWHHGLHVDETADACTWHVPAAHELESWSDARAFDGTASVQQPLIAPLYGGRPAHEILGLLLGEPDTDPHRSVRETWRMQASGDRRGPDEDRTRTESEDRAQSEDFEQRWREALHKGVIAGTAFPAVRVARRGSLELPAAPATSGGVDLLLRPDPHLWDGRYASIAWLQELPKPLTQLTWGNAALMSPSLAARLEVTNGDLIEVSAANRTVVVPAWIVARHAPESVTLHLGGGRQHAGPVGSGWGVNACRIQAPASPWHNGEARVRRVEGAVPMATVQRHHRMEGRDIVRSLPLGQLQGGAPGRAASPEGEASSLYPPERPAEYAWGMAIDLTACIGCNACTIACQAENNIPTVGKTEVMRGREMHWIRIDQYEEQDAAGERTHFQPVPCMQCEHAPCELVCPVAASVHDPQGINVQVYNRCVGTRFCSNNCPYKVRRFNFFQYAQDGPALAAQRNPEVTVRMRGVMEKCNYCLQRIIRARIAADREDRRIADGEVVTACQAACPTRAITFGDLNDPQSAVSAAKRSPRNYALLAELNTRPRTTYLAKITNPRPAAGAGS